MKVLMQHNCMGRCTQTPTRSTIPGSAQGHRVNLTGRSADPADKDKQGVSLRRAQDLRRSLGSDHHRQAETQGNVWAQVTVDL